MKSSPEQFEINRQPLQADVNQDRQAAPRMDSRFVTGPTPRGLAWLALLALTASLAAQERPAADGSAPRPDRPAAATTGTPGTDRAPRAERAPGAEPSPGRGATREEFPAELNLTDDQKSRLQEASARLSLRVSELAKKRESILTDEQKAAYTAAMQKVRGGNYSRQEASEALEAAVPLTLEQKTQISALDLEARQISTEATAQKTAILTEEQRVKLRKIAIANSAARQFTLPGGIVAADEQSAALKSLQDEFGPRLADLTEKIAVIMTDERQALRQAALKQARDSGERGADLAIALKLSDQEKTDLTEAERGLREMSQQIHERIAAILTPEQKAELEKRNGAGRSRSQ